MIPQVIKPCGKVKKEHQVRTKDRNSIAYKMSIQGTNSTAEYIAMIDDLSKKGLLSNGVSHAIHLAVSKQLEKSRVLCYSDFIKILKQSVDKCVSSQLYKTAFEMRHAKNVSFSTGCNQKDINKKSYWSKDTKISKKQRAEIDQIISQIENDNEERNAVIISEIDNVLLNVKKEMLLSMGLLSMGIESQKFDSAPPLEINLDNAKKKSRVVRKSSKKQLT